MEVFCNPSKVYLPSTKELAAQSKEYIVAEHTALIASIIKLNASLNWVGSKAALISTLVESFRF